MPAKTSNGKRYTNEPPILVGITEDSINATGGALREAEARLRPTELVRVTFFKTGEKRKIKRGDFYILGAEGIYEGVYLASTDGDEYEIADFKVAA